MQNLFIDQTKKLTITLFIISFSHEFKLELQKIISMRIFYTNVTQARGGSRAAAVSKMEHFVIAPSWMLQQP